MFRTQDSTQNSQYNGSIHHDGFKFHREYIGKSPCTYWCANNHSKESLCKAKIKICPKGNVMKTFGNHNKSCYIKQESTRKAMGFVNETDKENCPPDLTQKMLKMAEHIALQNMSMPPKKIHLQVLQDMEMKYNVFRGASNTKIINRIKNTRKRMNGHDIFRTIESENLSKMKNSNLFFYNLISRCLMSTTGNLKGFLGLAILPYFVVLVGTEGSSLTEHSRLFRNHFISA